MRAFFRRPAVLLVLVLCAIGLVVSLAGRLVSGPASPPKRIDLTSSTDNEACPSFSPDGRRLAYSARGSAAADAFHIFLRDVPSGTPRQLTQGDANDTGPSWSPDGASLAFLRVSEGHAQAIVVPAVGGPERQIAEFDIHEEEHGQPTSSLAWTHDGHSLIAVQSGKDQPSYLARIEVADGSTRRLTNPPSKTPGDSTPAVAPNGRLVAFVRAADKEGGDIWLCDLSGANLRRVTFDGRPIRGIAWMPDSQQLIYSANRVDDWRLWRVSVFGGSSRDVLVGGKNASSPAIALKGDRLAFSQTPTAAAIWRGDLGATDPEASAALLIRSSGREHHAFWSPDGKRIADVSDRNGPDEIWVGDAEWNDSHQLTHMNARRIGPPRWSPDGRTILFVAWTEGGPQVYTIPADRPGTPLRLHLPLTGRSPSPSWSRDGKSVYFVASQGLIWKAAADGSHPRQLTQRWGSGDPEEAADGKSVYYRNGRSIWRVPANGGEEQEAIVPDHDSWWITLQPMPKGIYYAEYYPTRHMDVTMFYDFRTQKSMEVFRLKDVEVTPDSTFSISPDGRYILYPKTDRSATNLALVENYR